MPGAPVFEIYGNMVRKLSPRLIPEVIPIGSENWRPLGVTGPPKDENYT